MNEIIGNLSLLIPSPCPFEMIRVGGDKDGGYLLPNDLNGITDCFSPGVNNFKNFEDELYSRFKIKSHMCDKSSDISKLKTPMIEGHQTFIKKWLDIDGADDSISLEDWLKEFCPGDSDLLLQMDIEGAEYRNILGTSQSILNRFRIIVMEIHALSEAKSSATFDKRLGPFIKKLSESFICVHVHPNNCCGEFIVPSSKMNMPNILEITWLRRDRFVGDSLQWNNPKIPHPLDIRRNVDSKPPIDLNDCWRPNGDGIESKVKRLADKCDYLEFRNTALEDQLNRSRFVCNALLKSFGQYTNSRPANIASIENMPEIAEGCPYTLSSSASSSKTGIVVNEKPFFFHTKGNEHSYITIDFGITRKVRYLSLRNRTDTCKNRAEILLFSIHKESDFSLNNLQPLFLSDDFFNLKLEDYNSVTEVPSMVGRYITIYSLKNEPLHLSAINVFIDPQE